MQHTSKTQAECKQYSCAQYNSLPNREGEKLGFCWISCIRRVYLCLPPKQALFCSCSLSLSLSPCPFLVLSVRCCCSLTGLFVCVKVLPVTSSCVLLSPTKHKKQKLKDCVPFCDRRRKGDFAVDQDSRTYSTEKESPTTKSNARVTQSVKNLRPRTFFLFLANKKKSTMSKK